MNRLRSLILIIVCSTIAISAALITPQPLIADEKDDKRNSEAVDEDKDSSSILGSILLYIPNRVFDLVDIVRLRARVGPGIAIGARVTEVADVFLGSYASVFAGLPGPRRKATLPLPVGLESNNGAEVSVVDATTGGGIGPDYSPTEIGLGLHLAIIGFDIGIDPIEIGDFFTGIFGIDLRDDDLSV